MRGSNLFLDMETRLSKSKSDPSVIKPDISTTSISSVESFFTSEKKVFLKTCNSSVYPGEYLQYYLEMK
jgi:hypothetical protein